MCMGFVQCVSVGFTEKSTPQRLKRNLPCFTGCVPFPLLPAPPSCRAGAGGTAGHVCLLCNHLQRLHFGGKNTVVALLADRDHFNLGFFPSLA